MFYFGFLVVVFFSPQIKGKLHTKLCTCSYSQHEYTLTFVSLCDRFAAIV